MDEKEEWSGTASELVTELKSRDSGLDLTANVLVRIMNAHTVMLRNFYKVDYRRGQDNRKNNVKIISLHLRKEIIVEPSDSTDKTDMSDICGHVVPIALIEPPQEA